MKVRKNLIYIPLIGFLLIGFLTIGLAQKPYRIGTTTANFLELGYGSVGSAMGDACVSLTNDLASVYWNPAGLSYMKQHEAQFFHQPWVVDISTNFAGVGLVFPSIGTLALSVTQVGYGDMEVTSLSMQNGTGEQYTASDMAITLSYARRLAQWFAFGSSAKFINSKIWHTSASAFAMDLGVIVNTQFLSPTGRREDGLTIGMSISNYGTKMKFDGMDLLHPIDILPNEGGNYRDVSGKFELQSWELPLIFRIGASINPFEFGPHRFTLAVDALHPNNNMESINIGGQYKLYIPTTGDFYLRAGYKALFLEDSEYGVTFGAGVTIRMLSNYALKLDFAYREIGILGNTNNFTVGVLF